MSENWKEINNSEIASIEKCVAEFNIWELKRSPYGKFKIKIFEDRSGKCKGYTNLQVYDGFGEFYCAVGFGNTIEEALENTINNYLELVSVKDEKEWVEEDFQCMDSFDF